MGGGECKSHKAHVVDNSPQATGGLCFRQYLEHPFISDLLKANVITAEYAGKQYQKAQKGKELLVGAYSTAIASFVSKGQMLATYQLSGESEVIVSGRMS